MGHPGAKLPDAVLIIGEIVVQLPEDDRKLLLNGRPWQFLELGPDENDLGVELMSIESTVAELSDVSERVDHGRLINQVLLSLLIQHFR